ncbi:MAG: hypothetical protein LBG80_20410 [Bacteroidales bacterium]|jgi:uncharacterized protein (TIGR02145 family)|nr:hypothetical protein [Bacteroidales bacterium]
MSEEKSNGIGVAGFVVSLVALFFGWIPFFGWFLWVLGLLFSFVGLFKSPRGFAIAGFLLSMFYLVVFLLLIGSIGALLSFLPSKNANTAKNNNSPVVELYESYTEKSDNYYEEEVTESDNYYEEEVTESDNYYVTNESYTQFQSGDYVRVTEDRAYFYNQPNESSKKEAYLVVEDIVEFLDINSDFGYVEFLHPVTNRTTKGWIRFEDVEIFDKEVTINNITWNTSNTGANYCYEYGNYYTLEEAKEVCPQGWRLPTKEEFQRLINTGYSWKTVSGIKGQLFGSGEKTVFLPASGYSNDEYIEHAGGSGFYWTSSYGDNEPFYLGFSSSKAKMFDNKFTYMANVRCVKKDNSF